MKSLLHILIILFTNACTEQKSVNPEPIAKDMKPFHYEMSDVINTDPNQQQNITEELLNLVKYIDSSGYICDSSGFSKTYPGVNKTRQFKHNNYLFYELKPAETTLMLEYMQNANQRAEIEKAESALDTTQRKWLQDWKEHWDLNIDLFEKANKIIAYFYVEKSSLNGAGNGTYHDGLIEEWDFPDEPSAKKAAEDLSKKETMAFMNRGAYVCYLNNHMYIFHARSAGFYTPLKKFLTHFSERNKAVIPNKRGQRKNY